MPDFVTFLQKALKGLDDASPAARQRLYARARHVLAVKLAAMQPPPAQTVAQRQKKALEEAIEAVERAYQQPTDDLLGLFDELAKHALATGARRRPL